MCRARKAETQRTNLPTGGGVDSQSFSHCPLICLLLLGAATATSCLKRPTREAKPVAAIAVVVDLSPSTVGDQRCDELAARVRRTLSVPGVKRLDVMAIGTGEGGTGLEPIVLVPWTRFEPNGRLYEQPGHAEAARAEWIESVRATCQRAVRPTNTSPIFAAIKRGAGSIGAHCAEIEQRQERCERRFLAVHSDMRDNGERAIRDRLAAETRGRSRTNAAPLPRIDVNGLDLAICGVSNTRLGAGEAYIDPSVLSSVWAQVLGPTMPAFDASCPVDAPPPAGANAVQQ